MARPSPAAQHPGFKKYTRSSSWKKTSWWDQGSGWLDFLSSVSLLKCHMRESTQSPTPEGQLTAPLGTCVAWQVGPLCPLVVCFADKRWTQAETLASWLSRHQADSSSSWVWGPAKFTTGWGDVQAVVRLLSLRDGEEGLTDQSHTLWQLGPGCKPVPGPAPAVPGCESKSSAVQTSTLEKGAMDPGFCGKSRCSVLAI